MKTFLRPLSLLLAAFTALSVSSHAQVINAFAGNHTQGYMGDGASALSAECFAPAGITVDSVGNIYFCDLGNSVVRKINTSGVISTVAGNGIQGFSGNGGPATAAKLYQPTSVAVDNHGNIFFTDDGNNMIRKVDASGIITTIAGTGTAGSLGNYGPAVAAQLSGPSGIALDHKGQVYIADVYNNAVRIIDTTGMIYNIAGGSGPGSIGNGGSAILCALYYPKGVTLDSAGNIFIVDQGNQAIRRINTGGVINGYAGNGTAGYSGDGGYGYMAELNNPTEVATDRAGNLYVADYSNHRIRKVKPSGYISTVAGNGTSGYSGDGGSPLAAQMAGPYGVAVDRNNKLYITDEINNVIRVIDMTTGVENELSLSDNHLKVYPNPTEGALTIEVPATKVAAEMTVVDVTGRTVQTYSFAASNQSPKVAVSGLANGTYFVSVSAGNNVYREKFVVMQ